MDRERVCGCQMKVDPFIGRLGEEKLRQSPEPGGAVLMGHVPMDGWIDG